jgi:hypothetical protein
MEGGAGEPRGTEKPEAVHVAWTNFRRRVLTASRCRPSIVHCIRFGDTPTLST